MQCGTRRIKNQSKEIEHMNIPYFDPDGDAEVVPSPCISVCKMDEKRVFCMACYRHLDEIAIWSRADEQMKRVIWRKILLRRASITNAK